MATSNPTCGSGFVSASALWPGWRAWVSSGRLFNETWAKPTFSAGSRVSCYPTPSPQSSQSRPRASSAPTSWGWPPAPLGPSSGSSRLQTSAGRVSISGPGAASWASSAQVVLVQVHIKAIRATSAIFECRMIVTSHDYTENELLMVFHERFSIRAVN